MTFTGENISNLWYVPHIGAWFEASITWHYRTYSCRRRFEGNLSSIWKVALIGEYDSNKSDIYNDTCITKTYLVASIVGGVWNDGWFESQTSLELQRERSRQLFVVDALAGVKRLPDCPGKSQGRKVH